jgi:M6 family metalloprotease-like protein
MKKILSFVTLAIAFGIQSVLAVPAHKGAVKMTQPDGTTVTIRLHGDEYLSFNTTTDGYSIVKNNQGYYVYAELRNGQLQPTARVAHDVVERSADEQSYLSGIKKYQTPAMTQAVVNEKTKELSRRSAARQQASNRAAQYDYSNFRGLIILVEFSDRSFSRSDYDSIVSDLANAENYKGFSTRYPYTGSVRDYFSDNSAGLFQPHFDVVGPVKVNRSQYYAKKTQNAAQVVYDAVTAADSKVNFKDYDRNNDGMVDMIYFIFAGYGSNYGGNDERLIWPHASQVYNPQNYGWVRKDGVYLGRYACSTELYGWSSQSEKIIDGIGTICHEFSHVLGLPDFYDTDYEENGGESHHPGGWDVMAGGSYNNYGRTPVGYTLFERYAIGFATPEVIDAPGQYTLQNVSNNVGYRINTPQSKEYFLLENRQKDKWNQYGPGHGMLVFRVDSTNSDVWNSNQVNVNPSHNYFELLRAGGYKSDEVNWGSDPFPGTKKVKTLNNETSPANMKTWTGKNTPLGLDNIKEANGVITFDVIDVNILTSVKLPETIDLNVGLSYPLTAERYPESAPYTLEWKSDNESVATVDEDGVVKGVGVGTAYITVTANGNENLKATSKIVVKDMAEYANINMVKTAEVDTPVKLLLNDAQVLYVHGSNVYVRDATGSMVFINANMNVKANDVLNGFVAGYSQVTNGIASLKALDGVDNDANITSVEGEPVEPHVLTLGQVNDSFYSDLITITEATLASTTVEGVKGVFASNDSVNVRVYNSFGLGSKDLKMPKSYAGKKFDLTGILVNTVATNGTVLYEIGLLKSPAESVVNSIQQMNTASKTADIYTLDGRRVENMLQPGIYIVRQGQNIRKVFVK